MNTIATKIKIACGMSPDQVRDLVTRRTDLVFGLRPNEPRRPSPRYIPPAPVSPDLPPAPPRKRPISRRRTDRTFKGKRFMRRRPTAKPQTPPTP